MIARRVMRTGDGSHQLSDGNETWGYGDKDTDVKDQEELENLGY